MTTQPPSHEEVQRLADELDNNQYCPMRAGRTLRSLLADNVRLSEDNAALRTRIKELLDHSLPSMQNTITAKDERIAALELKLSSDPVVNSDPGDSHR